MCLPNNSPPGGGGGGGGRAATAAAARAVSDHSPRSKYELFYNKMALTTSDCGQTRRQGLVHQISRRCVPHPPTRTHCIRQLLPGTPSQKIPWLALGAAAVQSPWPVPRPLPIPAAAWLLAGALSARAPPPCPAASRCFRTEVPGSEVRMRAGEGAAGPRGWDVGAAAGGSNQRDAQTCLTPPTRRLFGCALPSPAGAALKR